MQFGVYLSSVGEFSDPRLLAELASEAESAGWDGVFIWDHIGQPHAAADPWVTLTAMAMRTERVKLGPVVTPVARRRPWKLARETATLDQLYRLMVSSPHYEFFVIDENDALVGVISVDDLRKVLPLMDSVANITIAHDIMTGPVIYLQADLGTLEQRIASAPARARPGARRPTRRW